MKAFSSIAFLFFYLVVSIGVHVDIDTCCSTIAGFSVFSEGPEHNSTLELDCCAQEAIEKCCTSEPLSGPSCPSDCVFIQILQQAPQVTALEDVRLVSLEFDIPFLTNESSEISSIATIPSWYEAPPEIAKQDKLYLQFNSCLTYG